MQKVVSKLQLWNCLNRIFGKKRSKYIDVLRNEKDEFLSDGVSEFREFQNYAVKIPNNELKEEENDEEALRQIQHRRSSDITKIYFTYDNKNGTGNDKFYLNLQMNLMLFHVNNRFYNLYDKNLLRGSEKLGNLLLT